LDDIRTACDFAKAIGRHRGFGDKDKEATTMRLAGSGTVPLAIDRAAGSPPIAPRRQPSDSRRRCGFGTSGDHERQAAAPVSCLAPGRQSASRGIGERDRSRAGSSLGSR